MAEHGPQVYLFTYAGGGADAYAALALHLRAHCEPVTVNAFAHGAASETAAVAGGIEALRSAGESHRPYLVFGHSLGAIVAFAAVSALVQASRAGALRKLVVSACPPPDRGARILDRFDDLPYPGAAGGTMGPHARAAAALFRQRAAEQVTVFQDFRPQPGGVGPVPLQAYEPDSDPLVRPGEMTGWRRWTTGRFDLRRFPGSHFYFRPQAERVSAALLEPSWDEDI